MYICFAKIGLLQHKGQRHGGSLHSEVWDRNQCTYSTASFLCTVAVGIGLCRSVFIYVLLFLSLSLSLSSPSTERCFSCHGVFPSHTTLQLAALTQRHAVLHRRVCACVLMSFELKVSGWFSLSATLLTRFFASKAAIYHLSLQTVLFMK